MGHDTLMTEGKEQKRLTHTMAQPLLSVCGRDHFGSHSIGQSKFYDQAHINLAGLMAEAGTHSLIRRKNEYVETIMQSTMDACLSSTYLS